MTSKELGQAYHNFFVKSDAGITCFKQLSDYIEAAHRKAEDNPDQSRDYVQRAAGVREMVDVITAMMEGAKPKQ